MSELSTEFSTWKEELSSIESQPLANFNDTPEPHSFEVAGTNKLLSALGPVEMFAKPLYIKLVVEISKLTEEGNKIKRMESAPVPEQGILNHEERS